VIPAAARCTTRCLAGRARALRSTRPPLVRVDHLHPFFPAEGASAASLAEYPEARQGSYWGAGRARPTGAGISSGTDGGPILGDPPAVYVGRRAAASRRRARTRSTQQEEAPISSIERFARGGEGAGVVRSGKRSTRVSGFEHAVRQMPPRREGRRMAFEGCEFRTPSRVVGLEGVIVRWATQGMANGSEAG